MQLKEWIETAGLTKILFYMLDGIQQFTKAP